MTGTASIFIKSYRTDRHWLSYCLRSLQKFAKGFQETVVSIAEIDRPHFERFDFCGARVVWIDEPDDGRGYVRQQIAKLYADQYVDSDIIFYIDSDCFLPSEIRPEMFFSGDKPISLIRHWADVGTAIVWKPITEKFIGETVNFEGMPALPYVIDRRVLPLLRDYCQNTHKKDIESYVLAQPGNDFSEFNAMSAFSQRFTPYMYDWRIADPAKDGFPRTLIQRWSYSKTGVSDFAMEYEKILSA